MTQFSCNIIIVFVILSLTIVKHRIYGNNSINCNRANAMAQLLPSPLRHHPEDWKRSNLLHYNSAERDRAGAERLRAETKRMCKAVEVQTVQTRSDVENKLSGRVRDIKFWKEELERKVEENTAETDLLCDAKAVLEETLRSTNFPHEVANACLSYREGRIGIDLVHDEVEIQLKKV